jgi:site-specific DNA-cytosine methylase
MSADLMHRNPDEVREIRHFHLFCGLGGGAKGFNQASPRVGNMVGRFRCLGGIDVDAPAIRDFARLTGVRGTVLDLFDRDQFRDFHGVEPPAGWKEAGPADIRAAAGGEYPHIVFLSAPCKGFSGLLSENRSRELKYQALNRLTVRGVWLMLEAFRDDLPDFVLFENVPRISNRGRLLLDQIVQVLRAYGYCVAETTHDCGELGGLAQSRKRFLLVARNVEKVPPFLYEPEKKRLQAVGTVLDRMPLPGVAGGPMHRIPSLQWKTWVRLAFVEAGGDWRSLNRLNIVDGRLADYLIVPEMHNGALGVRQWTEPSGVVAGASRPHNGAFSVADPRFEASRRWKDGQQYGVLDWKETGPTVTGQQSPGQGRYAVADPRHLGPAKHSNEFRIVPWAVPSQAVTSAHGSGQAVADPRCANPSGDNFTVARYAKSHEGHGLPAAGEAAIPEAGEHLVAVIRSLDGTWHRPFTTFELAALQSLVEPEEQLELDGLSDSDWRERIGNAVPARAAEAIAGVMGTTLLLAWSGETFLLSSAPIWVRPVAVALAVAQDTRI